jgi:hypothetical protein
MTMTGVERLRNYGLSKTNIRSTCWKIIQPRDPKAGAPEPVKYSDNVEDVIRYAQRQADVKGGKITVDDIVYVLSQEASLKAGFQHFWNGDGVQDPNSAVIASIDKAKAELCDTFLSSFKIVEDQVGTVKKTQELVLKRADHIKRFSNIFAVLLGMAIVIGASAWLVRFK